MSDERQDQRPDASWALGYGENWKKREKKREEAKARVEADPATYIQKMLSKFDDEDRATFNLLIRMARWTGEQTVHHFIGVGGAGGAGGVGAGGGGVGPRGGGGG